MQSTFSCLCAQTDTLKDFPTTFTHVQLDKQDLSMVNSGFNNAPPERTSAQEPGPMGGAEHSFILSQDKSMPIAIIGMGFRGPADATTVDRLWKMILEGREGWSEIPKSRWNNSAFYHPDNSRHGTVRLFVHAVSNG